jgi:hypothetical protein
LALLGSRGCVGATRRVRAVVRRVVAPPQQTASLAAISFDSMPFLAKLPLRYPFIIAGLIVLGLFVRREVFAAGFFADDYAQLGMLEGIYPLQRGVADLFDFSDGSQAESRLLIDSGFYPWWADPQLRLAMFRPLASLMTALDHHWFGVDAFAQHVHSGLWWVVMLGVIAWLYRELLALPYALVAFALLILDESHVSALAWVCNRSVFVSTAAGLIMLHCYLRHRAGAPGHSLLWAALAATIAVGFGEYALCAFGYVLAYELLDGSGSRRSRLRALAAISAPALLMLVVRSTIGLNVRGSGVYVDPLADPLQFVGALLRRLPVLIADLVLGLRADYYTFGGPNFLLHWFERGYIPKRWVHDPHVWRIVHVAVGVVACGFVAVLTRYTLRGPRHANARWLLLGSVFALVPVCGSFPSGRLNVVAEIGFAPLLAIFIVDGLARLPRFSRRAWNVVSAAELRLAALAVMVLLYHLIIPLEITRADSISARAGSTMVREALLHMDVDEADLPHKELIMMNAIEGGTSMYLPMTRRLFGRTAPRSCVTLSFARAAYVLTRSAANGFIMRFRDDHSLLETAPEQLFRSARRPLHRLDSLRAGPLKVTVLDLFEDKPQRLQVDFDRVLEDPSLLFMLPTVDGIVVFRLPKLGMSVLVPAPRMPRVPSAERLLAGAS